MLWNPVQHVRDEWKESKAVAGKIAIVLFYILIWTFVLFSFYQFIRPLSFGFGTIASDMDEWGQAWLRVLIRHQDLGMIFFFLYAEYRGLTIGNVARVFVALILCWISEIHWWKPLIDDNDVILSEVLDYLWIVHAVIPGIVLLCAILEQRDKEEALKCWNPFKRIQDEWEDTFTVWGKTAVVLFYCFVWGIIVNCIVYMIYPLLGSNYTCLALEDDETTEWLVSLLRISAEFTLFFFLSAELLGPRPVNIFLVFLFCMIAYLQSLITIHSVSVEEDSKHSACQDGPWSFHIVLYVLGVTLLCSILEARVFPATQEELGSLTRASF